MIIDIHTHIFPEKIAARSIALLEEKADIKAATDGTFNGLKESAKKAQIDYSIVMPVATKPEQFDSINEFAAQINEKCDLDKNRILSFGGIHPDTPDYKEKLKRVKELGLKGIKLHPDYQSTMIDDVKYLNIIEEASSLGLAILVHAGIDIGMPTPVHCPPDKARKMLDIVKPEKLILAHYGGHDQWDMVEEFLVGQNVFFDTAFIAGRIDVDQFVRIMEKHGADKILFGSDSPWTDQKESVDFIKNLPISQEIKEQILWKNAAKLLGL